jgi:hypothetical protein
MYDLSAMREPGTCPRWAVAAPGLWISTSVAEALLSHFQVPGLMPARATKRLNWESKVSCDDSQGVASCRGATSSEIRRASAVEVDSWHRTGLPVFDCTRLTAPSGRMSTTGNRH